MNKRVGTALSVLIGGALIASACSSGGDESIEVAAEQTSTPVSTEAEGAEAGANTGAAGSETATETATGDELPGETVLIEAAVVFGEEGTTGTWDVVEGADVLGCDGGTLTEFPAQDQAAQELTCLGDREGSFVGRFSVTGSGPTFTANWEVIVASGDFDELSGEGTWVAEVAPDGESATFTLTLGVMFGEVAAPSSAFPRLSQPLETSCWDGLVAADGLAEYATVDETMFRLDLVTGEKTEHGAPPAECAWWFGDPEHGRRFATSHPDFQPDGRTKIWLGPYDGEWDVELEFEELTVPLSRSITSNRLTFFQPESGRVFMLDATTGMQVGDDIEGNFGTGRGSSTLALVTSADGRLIAFGGTSVESRGMLLMLDAESGAEVARLETDAPPTAVAFDADGTALVAGLFTGEVITIDTTTFEIVNEVSIGATATIGELVIRPDGLIVVWTEAKALVVDRVTGPTGAEVVWRHSAASRVRPDGSILSLTSIQTFEHYVIEGS